MKLIKNPLNTEKQLDEFCKKCTSYDFITIDTEFVRQKTFFPKISLIQIANKDEAIIIDAIKIKNLEPLSNILKNKKVIKVFHAPRQDLEIFYNLFKDLPKNIFDTQIASALLGLDEQISYEKLVLYFCNVEIEKKFQHNDWSLRPLSKKQIDYALNDVQFLAKIYPKIISKLKTVKRLDWALEETNKLLEIQLYENDPKKYWKRIKMKENSIFSLQKLKSLTEWREKKCMKFNLTRNVVLSDSDLRSLILKHTKIRCNVSLSLLKKYNLDENEMKQVFKILNQDDDTRKKNKKYISKFDSSLLNSLKLLLKIVSKKQNISENIIARVSDLEELLKRKDDNSIIFRSWRNEVFGKLVKKFLNGNLSLKVVNKQLDYM